MKKTLFLSIILALFFSACFSVQSVNPFSEDEEKKQVEKQEIEIPSDAPQWLEDRSIKDHISAIGATKNIDEEELNHYKKKALLSAGNNLLKRVYVKTVNIYKEYVEKIPEQKVFDKDIKGFAEHIALKALTISKIKNSFVSEDKELFVQIAVDTNYIAEQIQANSKLLFEVDKKLYHNFLSNRAHKDLIIKLEEEDTGLF